ncbi:MAG: imidazolonepropionase-like amidohydrolase/Tol biopolymer transport system component [Planctomycetaceae bacterium]|jgi:imidazolonepropionase-like amidohydrolase/Tol biopolymer transport system component
MPARLCLFVVCIALLCECPLAAQEKAKHQPPEKSVAASSAKEEPAGADAKDDSKEKKEPKWSIETPPGPSSQQAIDVSEGTWISVDVHPSGKEIVFDLLGDLYVMPISGADGEERSPEKLTSGIAWDFQPRFSHDGNWIAFTSDRDGKDGKSGDNIWIIERKTKELRQVTNEAFRLLNGPAWSSDDQYIVARKHFTSRRSLGAGEMWMYHRDAASLDAMAGVQLTKRPNDQKDVNEPVFSPDGKYLYYSQDSTPGESFQYDKDSNGQIYTVKRLDLEKGETESYITGPGGACRPTPSPDGKTIAFVRRLGPKTGLHLFDTESGAVRLIYDRLERDMQEAWAIHGVYPSFAWMPDGKSIVLWATGKIRRINVADGAETVIPFRIKDERAITEAVRFPVEVAPDEFDVKMLQWVSTSPNGKQVAFQALGQIYVRDLPDGEPKRLTNRADEFEFCPHWSRDGKQIVYTTWNDRTLGSIRIASATDPQQNRQVTVRPGHYVNPVLSPDGNTIVYEKSGGGRLRSPLYSHEPGIYRVSVNGGQPVLVSRGGSRPQFGESSDRVFLQRTKSDKDADNRKLYSVDLNGHEEREHFSSQWATDYRVSPDGRHIAFVERFNVYLAPFVKTGSSISIGPKFQGLPVSKLSVQAGDWLHFSGDSQLLHWSLGPELFTSKISDATRPVKKDEKRPEAASLNIGFKERHSKPTGSFALAGGRIVTMGPAGVIENGVVIVEDNRIKAVGSKDDVEVPANIRTIQIDGQTVLPGFIDTHAHGAQATSGMTPQRNWVDFARLSFGVTTIHDPSNNTQAIFAASELTKAGRIVAPRTFSTGTILYGAAGSFKAEIETLDDALFHLKRMKAVGAFSVKSYNQPRRDQRQKVIAAARELEMMVVPEGGSTFMHNMTMIVDGHTGIEHTLPVQSVYDDVMDLWRNTEVGYTPTLSVAYGGISGEQFWYEHDDLWLHERLKTFIPPHILNPRSRRRQKSPLEDYNHIRVAEIAKQIVDDGGLVQAGGHGQLNGICTHWEMWSFVQGGMTPMQALECGTLNGAKYVGLDGDLGSLEVGKLADILVMEPGADPTARIRDSERVQLTIANGRIFKAKTMTELNSEHTPEFFWKHVGNGISYPLPMSTGCSCGRTTN